MSEQSSFNSLEEARKNAVTGVDADRTRYYNAIGEPSEYEDSESFRQANEDFAKYLETRGADDEQGKFRDGKGKFTARYDADAHYNETISATAPSKGTLEELAKKVADAREADDKTAVKDAEEAFYERFLMLSEKYGWEQEDDSVTDKIRLDKDAPMGRTTIDDRLQRYADIMYGNNQEPSGQATTSTEAEADSAPEPEIDAVTADTSEKMDVAAEIQGRLNAQAAALEAAAVERINRDSDERVAPINQADRHKKTSETTDDAEEDNETDVVEPINASERRSTTTDTPEAAGSDASTSDSTETEPATVDTRGFGRKIMDRARTFYRSSLVRGGGSATRGATAYMLHPSEKRYHESDEAYERRTGKEKRNKVLGVVATGLALAGTAYIVYKGFELNNTTGNGGDMAGAEAMATAGDVGGGIDNLGENTVTEVVSSVDETAGEGFKLMSEAKDAAIDAEPRPTAEVDLSGSDGTTEFGPEGMRDFNSWVDGYKVKPGDTVWSLAERYLESKGKSNPSVYEIDAVKDTVLSNFQKKGIVGGNGWLMAGDILNTK